MNISFNENNLLALRTSLHMTQKEFATEVGINVGVYSRYERGENDIPLSVAKKIALVHNTSIDYIAGIDSGIDYATIIENSKETITYANENKIKFIIKVLEQHGLIMRTDNGYIITEPNE